MRFSPFTQFPFALSETGGEGSEGERPLPLLHIIQSLLLEGLSSVPTVLPHRSPSQQRLVPLPPPAALVLWHCLILSDTALYCLILSRLQF